MSIWGPAASENDDAADWLAEIRDEPALAPVVSAIGRVIKRRKGYLEVDVCCEAVAAAEVLAAASGVAGTSIVSKSAVLVVRRGLQAMKRRPLAALWRDAKLAIATVLDDAKRSELHQLWADAKQRAKWRANLTDLRDRIGDAPAAFTKLPLVPAPNRNNKRGEPREPNLGKVFAIRLPDKRYAYAKGFRGYQFGVYDLISKKVLPLDDVIATKLAFHVCAIDVAPRRGKWQLLGEDPFASDDDAWGVPLAYGLANFKIATHLSVVERGVQRTVPYEEAVGITIMAMGNDKHTVQSIVERLVHKRPSADVVLPKSDPRVI